MRALERQTDTAAHWSEREYDALFAAEAPPRMALVATDNDETCGFLIARCGPDEWEIENVVVSAQRRRQGIASVLVQEMLQSAQGTGAAILLEVRESNTAARQLYQKLGFNEAGRRSAYYRDPAEDALLLRFSMAEL